MTDTPNAEHLDWRTIFKIAADAPDKTIAALDAYFEPFAQPVFDESMSEQPMRCLKCSKPLTGLFASMFGGGGWEWGIAHGEGCCASCGWPGRAMHYINHADGTEVVSIRNLVLQYHPDVVSTRSKSSVEAA